MKIKKKNNEIEQFSISRVFLQPTNLILLQILLTAASSVYGWSLQYQKEDGMVSYLKIISFISSDKPWMPPGLLATPIFGYHYFGDWTLNIGYGIFSDPYNPNLPLPSQFPPFGLLFYGLMSVFGFRISYLLLITMTLLIWIRIINFYLNKFSILEKTLVLVFSVLFTTPAIIAFDRGGVQLFCIGLIGLALINYETNRISRSLVCFILAVSLKPYLLTSLIILFVIQKNSRKLVRHIISTMSSLVIVNIFAMSFYSENIIKGIFEYINVLKRFAGVTLLPYVQDSVSFMGFLSKSNEIFYGTESSAQLMTQLLGSFSTFIAGGFVFILLIILRFGNFPRIITIPLSLSTVSFLAPPSGNYTLTWGSLAFIVILSSLDEIRKIRQNMLLTKINIYLIIATSYLILTPYFGMLNGRLDTQRSHPGGYFATFCILLIYAISLVSVILHSKNRSKNTNVKGIKKTSLDD